MNDLFIRDADYEFGGLTASSGCRAGCVDITAEYGCDVITTLVDYDGMVALRDYLTERIDAIAFEEDGA